MFSFVICETLHISKNNYYCHFVVVTTLMDQVVTLAQFSTVGWAGFNQDPPTLQECLDAIHKYLGHEKDVEVSVV